MTTTVTNKATNIAERFAPFEQRMRAERLPANVIDSFRYYYEVLATGDTGMIAESSIDPVADATSAATLQQYVASGQRALGRAVMLKLNGGLGTGMGLDKAKSLLPVRDGLTFLDISIRQNLVLREQYGTAIPLVLMNSFSTDADTNEVLARYPELASDVATTLLQHKVPKVLRDTLEPATWAADPELEWCPPGHGELYIVLVTSGMLDTLIHHGYEYLFISNADNLGATLDPAILGYVAERQLPFLMEVTERTEADKKGGHIARRHDGHLLLREIAQCPETDLDQFQDITRHRYFNTNNIWINLVQLQKTLAIHNNLLKLPMIRNIKTIDPRDSNSPVVYQLETAMGAAIEIFAGADVVVVDRSRFMPVKTCQDLLAIRSDMYHLDEMFHLRQAAQRTLGPVVVTLDNRFYKVIDDFEARFPAPPSLMDCAELTVEGDVVFEPAVVVRGNVSVVNRSDEQRCVPHGTVLEDTLFETACSL